MKTRDNVKSRSITIGPADAAIIDAVRAKYGISFNAAVRYCIRAHGVEEAAGADKRRARADLANWLAETRANRKPGRRE